MQTCPVHVAVAAVYSSPRCPLAVAMNTSHELEHHTHHPKGTREQSNNASIRSSDQDKVDLQVRGVQPVFNRIFRVPGSIAYTINSIISAEYFIISLAYLLYNGGRALLTFGLLAHLPRMACLYRSLGEMMSMSVPFDDPYESALAYAHWTGLPLPVVNTASLPKMHPKTWQSS